MSPLPFQPYVHGVNITGNVESHRQPVTLVAVLRGRELWRGPATPHVTSGSPATHRFDLRIPGSALPTSRLAQFIYLYAETDDERGAVERTLLYILPVRRGAMAAPPRWAYGAVWNQSARNLQDAMISVAGYADQAEWQRTGISTCETVVRTTGMTAAHDVLEVGCGVARVGVHMAKLCRTWTGADVSERMLMYAREATQDHSNVRFVHINGHDLSGIETASMDVVYCTAVFMHIEEWDRYRYVTEFFRVLRPGGRVYYDNFDLRSPEGWKVFLDTAGIDVAIRPANVSKASTPQELEWYAQQAGFADIATQTGTLWVTVTATKPAAA